MSVVLQTRYAPGIAPGVEGMIADTTPSTVGTRICETAAGIPFGKAVSAGAPAPRAASLAAPSSSVSACVTSRWCSRRSIR